MFGKDAVAEEDSSGSDSEAIRELHNSQEALEREMAISQCVKASTLEEVNLGMLEDPWSVNIVKELVLIERKSMVELLKEYRDVFAWSYEDMKGLDPKF